MQSDNNDEPAGYNRSHQWQLLQLLSSDYQTLLSIEDAVNITPIAAITTKGFL